MIAEILSVGTELLMGQIANTDAQFISRRLGELGVTIYRHSTVGDNPARVREALQEALSRSDMVITTGGLGPTEDDLTKEMVAEYFGLEMELHQPSLDALKAFMERFGKKMTPNNLKQAYFPRGCAVMPNACGTAPGCIRQAAGALSAGPVGTGNPVPFSENFRAGRIQRGDPAFGSVPFGQSHPGAVLRAGRGYRPHHRPGRRPGKGGSNDAAGV